MYEILIRLTLLIWTYNKVNSNNNIYLLKKKKKNWSEDDTNFLFIFFSVTKLWTLFKSFRDEYFWYFIMLISSTYVKWNSLVWLGAFLEERVCTQQSPENRDVWTCSHCTVRSTEFLVLFKLILQALYCLFLFKVDLISTRETYRFCIMNVNLSRFMKLY